MSVRTREFVSFGKNGRTDDRTQSASKRGIVSSSYGKANKHNWNCFKREFYIVLVVKNVSTLE